MDEAEIHQLLAQACCPPHAFYAFVVCPCGDLIPLDDDSKLLSEHPHDAWLQLPAAAYRHGMSFIEVAQLAMAKNRRDRDGYAKLQAVVDWRLLYDRLPLAVTVYRRRTRGSNRTHITPTEPVVHGSLVRQPGELLCRRGDRRSHDPDPIWDDSPPDCPRCLRRAELLTRPPSRAPIRPPVQRPIMLRDRRSMVAVTSRTASLWARPHDRLLGSYHDYLTYQLGHEVTSWSVSIPGEVGWLSCDLYDVTAALLVEVKTTTTRQDVRMAIGELVDYLRFAPPATRPAILLPARPSDDLVNLITGHGIVLVYEETAGTAYPQVLPDDQDWLSRSVAAGHITTH